MPFIWEKIKGKKGPNIRRAKVPGGWLIYAESGYGGGVTFLPDPKHEWDGNSLDLPPIK